jgi:chloramphenicol O-acetyltransferase type A
MLRAANATEAFRLRLRKRGVWQHDRVAVGPTLLRSDHTFAFARIEPSTNLKRFIASGTKAIRESAARHELDPNSGDDDIVYQSSLPWLRFTAFTNAIDAGDSIPGIVFGQCAREGRRYLMPMSVEGPPRSGGRTGRGRVLPSCSRTSWPGFAGEQGNAAAQRRVVNEDT